MARVAGMNSTLALASEGDPRGLFGRVFQRLWPSAAFRQFIIERVRRRGVRTPPYPLAYRNIFILPTGFGFAFGLLLILMALGGLNFNNNLALLLVFMLAALAQMTTHLAYRNLSGLEIVAVRGEPAFAGDPLHLHLVLHNPEDRNRFALEGALATDPVGDCTDADPESGTHLEVKLETGRKHQIRRHLKTVRHPILGDTRYGDRHHNHWAVQHLVLSSLALRAMALSLSHPVTGERLCLRAGLNDDWTELFRQLGWYSLQSTTVTEQEPD